MSSNAWTIFTVSRFVRLVDTALWRLGRIPVGNVGQRNRCVRTDILSIQNGCSTFFGLQFGRCRFLHGSVFGHAGRCGRFHSGRISNVCHSVANECWLPNVRISSRSFVRIVRVHAGRHYVGTKLCHHTCNASEQKTFVAARRLHYGRRLDVFVDDGNVAAVRHIRLSEVCRLFAVRDDKWTGQFGVRGISDVHQWRSLSHSDGMLPEDVLRDPWIPSMEFERFTNSQANGIACVHRLYLLVTNCISVIDCRLWIASHFAGTGESVYRLRAAAELMLQSISVRNHDETV